MKQVLPKYVLEISKQKLIEFLNTKVLSYTFIVKLYF